MLIVNLLTYIASFFFIWIGAGFIISSAEKFSHKLKLSSFAISFFILGLLTSIPEIAVGLTSVGDRKPDIFVGNLIGGIPVIFLFIIPILAILSNGLKLNHEFSNKKILLSLGVMIAPSVFALDQKITNIEGVILIAIYFVLFFFVQREKGILDLSNHLSHTHSYSVISVLKIILGIIIVTIASNIIVDKTTYFANVFSIPTFYLSLVLLSIGTNLPELSLAIRSVISGTRDIAFGDYIGSAAANTLLFGIFTLMVNGEVITSNNFMKTLVILTLGLGTFYYFSSHNRSISRGAGIVLLVFYFVFVISEWTN